MSSVKENLIAARALIDTPEKWIKGTFSNDNGCFCALGAVDKALGLPMGDDGGKTEQALYEALPPFVSGVADFNDAPTTFHADIMALFDRAIAAQEPTP
jgi:hypothetical protein